MQYRGNRQTLEDFFYVIFLTFTSIQNLRRVPWVDEFQAFNLATKSKNYFDLILAASADLHPPLWHILIRLFSYAWDDYNVIKILLFVITVLTVFAIRKMTFLPFFFKACILLSSYFTFTYTSVSRDYSLLICITFWIIYFHKSRSLGNIKYLLIALLSFVNVFGLFFSFYFLLLSVFKSRNRSVKIYALHIFIVICQFLSAIILNPWNKDGVDIIPGQFDFYGGLVSYSQILFQSISPTSPTSQLGVVFGSVLILVVVNLIILFSEQPKLQVFSWLLLTLLLVLFASTGFPYGTHEWNRGMYFLSILIPLILIYPTNIEINRLVRFKALVVDLRRNRFLIGVAFFALLMPTIVNTYHIYRNSKLSMSSFTFYHDPMREFVKSIDCFDKSNRVYLVSDTYGDWVSTQMNSYLPKSKKIVFFVSDNNSPWIKWTRQRSDMNVLLQKSESALVKRFIEAKHECFVIQDLIYIRNLEDFQGFTISESTPQISGYLKPNRFFLLQRVN